jgi:hypothetical protein
MKKKIILHAIPRREVTNLGGDNQPLLLSAAPMSSGSASVK